MCRKVICLISFIFVLGMAVSASADLVAHWTFDEGSGTTAFDSSGNGHNGTFNGDATWAAGHLGGALQLDGSGDYLNCGLIDIDTAVTGGLTVCAWINKSPGGDMKFCSNRQGDNAAGGGFTCTIYDDRMEMDISNATARTLNRDTDGPTVPANIWVHVAWVYDDVANTFNEYHDGVLADSSTENTSVGVSTQEFRIGADAPSLGRYVNGLLDDLRIYNSALSEQELLGVMQGGGVSYPFASRPSPDDGALYADTWVSLSWSPGDSAVSHDVYMGDNFDDVSDGLADVFQGNQASPYFVAGFPGFPFPDGLVNGTTYYWRIDEVNEADPNSPWKGDIWSFWIPSIKAYKPNPADGAKFIDPESVDLTWTAGFGAKLHTVYFGEDYDTVANATDGAATGFASYSPGPLELEKTYYWRIDEFDGAATHTGEVWSFRTMPDIAITDPNLIAWWKLDEGSGNTALDWSGHGNHAAIGGTPDFVPGYDGDALDFDGSTDFIDVDGQLASGTFSLTMWIRPRDIPYLSGYYAVLHNDAWNAGSLHVHLRNTSSLINADINSGPAAESATVLQADQWYHCALTVTDEGGNASQLYINGVLEASGSGGDGTPYLGPLDIGSYQNGDSRHYHGLMDDIRVYNRMLTADEVKDTMRGDPLVAWDPNPVNSSTPDIDSALPLTWSPGDKASQHDVYFGADKAVVEDADASDTGDTYRGRQSGTSYTLHEGVEWGGGPYYWRIDENNNDGTVTKGRVWTFTVADFILVDDFESYDAGDNQIWYAWHDGLGYGAPGTDPYFAGNGTGSAVGDETTASYTEETIVNSGGQSMPLAYDNNKQGFSKYSEAELTLTAPRDWTKNEVEELSLWFRGYAGSVGSFVEGPVGTYTMTGAGADIWNNGPGAGEYYDEFHYAYKMLTGAGSIVAKVESVQETNVWAKAGVMIRETLEGGSKHAFSCVTPGSGVSFQSRPDPGAASSNFNQGDFTAPYWVKLERDVAGNFSAYHSANGSSWQLIEEGAARNIPMTSNVYIGLALTSHEAAITCEAVFSNVTITGTVGPQWANQDIGITSNAAEPLYVAVSNTAGQPAVVVHDDPAAATIDTWTEWRIPLQAFADQGIVLTNVDKIAIGLGTQGNTTIPGGSGKMFFDDIRLFRPEPLDGI